MEHERKNNFSFQVGLRELIIIIGFAIVLATTMQTRASKSELASLDARVQKIENKFEVMSQKQDDMKIMLAEINSDIKKLLDRTSTLEAKIK
jgi:uncharacterized protein YktB (UPF0637 family)